MKKKSKVIIALVVIIIAGVTIFFATEDKRTEWEINQYAKKYDLTTETPYKGYHPVYFDGTKICNDSLLEVGIIKYFVCYQGPEDNIKIEYEWKDETGEGLNPGETAEVTSTLKSNYSTEDDLYEVRQKIIIYYPDKNKYMTIRTYDNMKEIEDYYIEWSDYHNKIDNEHVVCRLYPVGKKEIKKVD